MSAAISNSVSFSQRAFNLKLMVVIEEMKNNHLTLKVYAFPRPLIAITNLIDG
jgi:hypothetical protein